MAGFFLSLSPQPCLFPLLPILKVKVKSVSRVRLFATWWTVASQAPPSMGFSRQEYCCEGVKNTGVGCHFLLQGIFLTQGSNLGLLHRRQMLYPLSHQGSPSWASLNSACTPSALGENSGTSGTIYVKQITFTNFRMFQNCFFLLKFYWRG